MTYIIYKTAQYTFHKHVNMTQINHIFTDIKRSLQKTTEYKEKENKTNK